MKNLQFEHDGVKYMIDFEYHEEVQQYNHYPRPGVRIYEERDVRSTYVFICNEGGRIILGAHATCQPEDRFVKETGRSLAIRKLAKSLTNHELASAMLKCYFNRPRGKKNGK